MPAIKDADLQVLPNPLPIVGDGRPNAVSGGSHQHFYAATGRPTIEVPLSGPDDIDRAVRAARAAAAEWRDTSPEVRRSLLWKLARAIEANREELIKLQTVENGIPVLASNAFIDLTIDGLEYYSGWSDKITGLVHPVWPTRALDYSMLEPYGVVAVIIPWNSPLYSLGSVVSPALTAGNTVVVKPPELTPFSSLRFAELALEVGFPPGVINIVPGGGAAGAELVAHRGIDKIHFTGSGPTAKKILVSAAENMTPVGLELGGKSPNVVFGDADLNAAAAKAVQFCMQVSGQGCVNGTRLLVEDQVYEEVVELVRTMVGGLTIGDPTEPSTTFGPVINEPSMNRVLGMIDRAKADSGGTVVAGGNRATGFVGGYFVEPTVIAGVDEKSEIARQEVFGPVLAILPFTGDDEAIRIANDTPYGLGAYIQTTDINRALRFAKEVDSGMVWVNGGGGLPPSIPFGGDKQSGTGRLGGYAGLEEFSRTKNVWIAL